MFEVGDRVIYVGEYGDIKNFEGVVVRVRDETVVVDLDNFTHNIHFHNTVVEQHLLLKLNREPDWEV
jgi:hypothetical protein